MVWLILPEKVTRYVPSDPVVTAQLVVVEKNTQTPAAGVPSAFFTRPVAVTGIDEPVGAGVGVAVRVGVGVAGGRVGVSVGRAVGCGVTTAASVGVGDGLGLGDGDGDSVGAAVA